jgi:hypothetical protein
LFLLILRSQAAVDRILLSSCSRNLRWIAMR